MKITLSASLEFEALSAAEIRQARAALEDAARDVRELLDAHKPTRAITLRVGLVETQEEREQGEHPLMAVLREQQQARKPDPFRD